MAFGAVAFSEAPYSAEASGSFTLETDSVSVSVTAQSAAFLATLGSARAAVSVSAQTPVYAVNWPVEKTDITLTGYMAGIGWPVDSVAATCAAQSAEFSVALVSDGEDCTITGQAPAYAHTFGTSQASADVSAQSAGMIVLLGSEKDDLTITAQSATFAVSGATDAGTLTVSAQSAAFLVLLATDDDTVSVDMQPSTLRLITDHPRTYVITDDLRDLSVGDHRTATTGGDLRTDIAPARGDYRPDDLTVVSIGASPRTLSVPAGNRTYAIPDEQTQ